MRVAVIGGSGHIGSYLTPRLVEAGFDTVCVSRSLRRPYVDHPAWGQVRHENIDRDSEEFGARVAGIGAQAVIDLTCYTQESARQLVQALRGKAERLLHCGTIWVHGVATEVPTPEDQSRGTFGDYGIRKAAIEEYLLSQEDVPATVLHPGHLVGEGWIPLNPAANFNPRVFADLANGRPVALPHMGRETVHHVHADDVAQCFVRALQRWPQAAGQSFHVVSPAALTLIGYAEAVAGWYGREAQVEFLPWDEWRRGVTEKEARITWDHIARSPNCSIEKARRLLGYEPRYRSLDAVRESLFSPLFPLLAQTDWPSYGHDAGGQRYSPLKQIGTKNVARLQLAWTFDLQAPVAASTRARRSSTTPLVVNGVMYLSTPYNRALALEPETGKKIWEYAGAHPPGMRGIAYWPGDRETAPRIVFGTNDGWLIFLDAKTGALACEVNLRPGVADRFPKANYGLSSPPAIYRNLVITGSHVQENPSLGPSGDVRAWDARTGKLVWTFHTLHQDAWRPEDTVDRSGLNVWGFITVDEARGLAFLPVGTPATDFYGADRKGSNLYGSSLVALDAATGTLKWFYQTTHHDNWDYDLEAPPLLFDLAGKPAVAQFTKQGLLFLFDRLTGKPLYGVEERPVTADNPFPGGGDEPWPTQPFPLRPPALARNSFRPEEIATVTPEHEKYCRALLAQEGGAMTGGPYAQYGAKLRVIFPAWIGGGNWGGMSYHPKLGYLFVNTQNLANFNKIIRAQDGTRFLRVGPDDKNLSLGEGSLFWDGEKNWPCQQPPWGEMAAVNVKTGAIAWRVPLGSFEELDAKGVPKTGTPNMGGSIATAGGLVFIAATIDAKIRALDARTGRELWSAKMDADAQATPMTFQGKDGKQYLAVVAGGSVHYARPGFPGRLYVYGLP